MTAPAMSRTVTEYGAVVTQSGNVWNRYGTREEAQAFVEAAPAPMHVVSRLVTGDTRTGWVTA